MKYYNLLMGLLLFLSGVAFGGFSCGNARAEDGVAPIEQLDASTDWSNRGDPSPAMFYVAECVGTATGSWAEVDFPSKSVLELSKIRAYAYTGAIMYTTPTSGYQHERVPRVLLRYGGVAAECLPQHSYVTFALE